jgi:hypothetical protein
MTDANTHVEILRKEIADLNAENARLRGDTANLKIAKDERAMRDEMLDQFARSRFAAVGDIPDVDRAEKAIIGALKETIAAQERTIIAKTNLVKALENLLVLKHREVLVWFTAQMEQKLRANDYKGGWHDSKLDDLFDGLLEEVEELRDVVKARKGAHIIEEAADVANFCMMLADRVRE